MRFLHIVGLVIAMGAVATAFLGWNGVALSVALGAWAVARVSATFVGLALAGWFGAVGLFLAVVVLEAVARAVRTHHEGGAPQAAGFACASVRHCPRQEVGSASRLP
jgi:hypothetical protein